jgi:hypothetical protein
MWWLMNKIEDAKPSVYKARFFLMALVIAVPVMHQIRARLSEEHISYINIIALCVVVICVVGLLRGE